MKKISKDFILPSAGLTICRRQVKFCKPLDKAPEVGDVAYGTVIRVGQHSSLENPSGRIHLIQDGTRAVFVFGNRYAPDFYEGLVPDHIVSEVDLLARSGVIGIVKTKNSRMKDATAIKLGGYVCAEDGTVLNTTSFPLIRPKATRRKEPRAKMVLVCGTSMNSGKSMAASACCWALHSMGRKVRGAKVTGTASLQDILHMNDAGAEHYADFTAFGYPSTYLLPETTILRIFRDLDLKYANNPRNFWVVECADGINQRETSMLLRCESVRKRIHKLIFCANDAFGAIGGLRVLKEQFNLVPDGLSGVCSSSPLHVRELSGFTDIPVFNSLQANLRQLGGILMSR